MTVSQLGGRTIDTVLGPIKVNPECKGQAVCTNGSRCWEAGECLRPYRCGPCGRSTASPDRLCSACRDERSGQALDRSSRRVGAKADQLTPRGRFGDSETL